MPTWSEVTKPYGTYISEVFDISNSLNRYIVSANVIDININNQRMDFYYSVSNDNINWTEWAPLQIQSSDFLNQYNLTQLYFKYKVIFASTNSTDKPFLQSISITYDPYFLFENITDMSIRPKLWLRRINGDGDITIVNHMTGQKMILNDIQNGEEVFIDCENEDIVSSLQSVGVYRYDNHNDEWLDLGVGESYIKTIGDFDMDIRYQGKLLQE